MREESGFTLAELIIAIIVISISVLSVALMYHEVLRGAFQVSAVSKATALAEEEMEQVLSKGYSGVSSVPLANFASPFSDYSYEVTVHYVNPEDLDTPVDPTQTEYKNVEVKVKHSDIADIELVSLLSNYTD